MNVLLGSLAAIILEVDPWQLALIVGGVVTAFLALLGALTMAARSNSKNSQTTVNIFDTLVQLNNELTAASEERLKHAVERERWEASRNELNRRVNEQADEIEKNKRLAKEASELHTQALDHLQKELQTAVECQRGLEASINDLANLVKQKDEQIGELTAQIAVLTRRILDLEKENRDLIGKVGSLESERAELRSERVKLIQQLAGLEKERDEQKRQLDEMKAKLDALEKRDTGALHTDAAEASETEKPSSEETAAEAADSAHEGEQTS